MIALIYDCISAKLNVCISHFSPVYNTSCNYMRSITWEESKQHCCMFWLELNSNCGVVNKIDKNNITFELHLLSLPNYIVVYSGLYEHSVRIVSLHTMHSTAFIPCSNRHKTTTTTTKLHILRYHLCFTLKWTMSFMT